MIECTDEHGRPEGGLPAPTARPAREWVDDVVTPAQPRAPGDDTRAWAEAFKRRMAEKREAEAAGRHRLEELLPGTAETISEWPGPELPEAVQPEREQAAERAENKAQANGKTTVLHVRLAVEEKHAVEVAAQLAGVTVSALVRRAVIGEARAILAEYEEEDPI
jgi:uncharacterized protein (DUF1778 family)